MNNYVVSQFTYDIYSLSDGQISVLRELLQNLPSWVTFDPEKKYIMYSTEWYREHTRDFKTGYMFPYNELINELSGLFIDAYWNNDWYDRRPSLYKIWIVWLIFNKKAHYVHVERSSTGPDRIWVNDNSLEFTEVE